MASTTMKLLVPLSTAVVAGAVALGSGATFTSEKGATIAVTAGDILQYNSRDGLTLTVSNLKPGAVESGDVLIRNDGSLDATLAMSGAMGLNGFETGVIELEILDGATVLWGPEPIEDFGLDENGDPENEDLNLSFEADPDGEGGVSGGSKTLTVRVSMTDEAGNLNQAKSLSTGLDFVLTQTDHATNDESGAQWSEPTP